MQTCEFCGSELPNGASFCGYCGRSPSHATDAPTSGMDLRTIQSSPRNMPNPPHGPAFSSPQQANQPWQQGTPSTPNQRDDEEERRKRAALLGLGLPLAGDMARLSNNVPMGQGTPQAGIPLGHGTPPTSGQGITPTWYASPTVQAPQTFPPPQGGMPLSSTPHPPPSPTRPGSKPSGCAPIWLVFVIAIILIIASIIGAGFTVFAPSLSIVGGPNVTIGGTLHLHGSSFLPGSNVTLTIDSGQPLYYSQGIPPHLSHNGPTGLALFAFTVNQVPTGSNVVNVGSSGTFDVNIAVGADWQPGTHTVHASEGVRSTELSFTVLGQGVTVTPSPSPSPSPSVTVTPSVTPTGFSCINPNSITLGPVSEGYNQPISTPITLCSNGNAILNWTASWDQNQAPWLQLDPNSGHIAPKGTQDVTVSAVTTGLKAATYTTTVTFSSAQSDKNVTLNVTLIIKAGCINVQPTTLSFSGVAGISDPSSSQTVSITNCGVTGTWSASVATTNNQNWLSVSPTSGALDNQGTVSATISASNLKAQLAAGTYTGSVTFTIGSQQAIVNVTLTVQAGPQLILNSPSNNPPSFNANTDCQYTNAQQWLCIASITNGSSNLSLNWTSSSTGVQGITFSPASGTLAPGQTMRVQIYVPANNCQTATTLTFTGPANTVNIGWSCTIIS